MPAILDEETVALWLDPQTTSSKSLQPILKPAPNDILQSLPVSRRVNSYKNDDSRLVAEEVIGEPESPGGQLGLFGDEFD
jgi:putative SOS response-associated peptidase YedK